MYCTLLYQCVLIDTDTDTDTGTANLLSILKQISVTIPTKNNHTIRNNIQDIDKVDIYICCNY